MAFRADEKAREGREEAFRYLLNPRYLSAKERERSEGILYDIIDKYGPVVEAYPHWHPIVGSSQKIDRSCPARTPGEGCGYRGLDHTVYLRNGFITCPYHDAESIFESVNDLRSSVADINAEKLDIQLYMPNATPVLVTCEWERPMENDGTVPKSLAVPLLLEKEVPCWRTAEVAETWETMRPYILGSPRGSRSSLFVNQETGQVLKTIWNALIFTGMFGPIRVD